MQGGSGTARRREPEDETDRPLQVLWGQRTLITDKGLLRGIHADTAYFFDENTLRTLRVVDGVFFDSQGAREAVLTARTGIYNQRLNSLEAYGDSARPVIITAIDGRRLETSFVRYNNGANLVSSESTFTMTEPGGRVVHGIGFVTDPDLNNVKVLKLISAKAGPVVVPK